MTAPRIVDQPQPGLFLGRFCKGCPFVPCEIRHAPTTDPDTGEPMAERPWYWSALLCGQPWGNAAPSPTPEVLRIWNSGRPMDARAHALLTAQAQWDREHQPSAPLANPLRPVDPRGPIHA